jgi:hypothetical protein
MAPYYRIEVRDYEQFEKPYAISSLLRDHADDIRRDIQDNHPPRYPFFCTASGGALHTVQGNYLTRCSPRLVELIMGEVGGATRPPTSIQTSTATGTRYWSLGAGEGARLWSELYDSGLVAIGWDALGDLRNYRTKEDIAAAIAQHRDDEVEPIHDAHACYQFCREMAVGDYVLIKRGRSEILGLGRITTDYEYKPERSEYRHVRGVQWLAKGSWLLPEQLLLPTKTLTDVTDYKAFLDYILPLFEQQPPTPRRGTAAPLYTVDDACQELFLRREEIARILQLWSRKKNLILEGPPGVGKTFVARRIAYAMIGYKDRTKVEAVQFHQSYAYEDFIQGWRPKPSGGFFLKDGIFHQFCAAAEQSSVPHVFIIDEINRGNLSKVFGELMMLIEADKRGSEFAIPLTYSKDRDQTFFVPENLYLLGLMNTADRSLAMVDYALRRRFVFHRLSPAFDSDRFREHLMQRGASSQLADLIRTRMNALNAKITADAKNLGPGFEVGHSFFCPEGTEERLDEGWYADVVKTEIEPLLREYWFDSPEVVAALVGDLLA